MKNLNKKPGTLLPAPALPKPKPEKRETWSSRHDWWISLGSGAYMKPRQLP